MEIKVAEKLYITKPSQKMRDWCEKELIIPNPEYSKKRMMGFWVGDTPKHLYLYEKRGSELVLPFGLLTQIPKELLKKTIFHNALPFPVSAYFGGVDVPLYDYQKEAVDAAQREHFGIIQSAAGSGKTQMGIALVKRFGVRALWLTHTIDLLNQSKERALLYIDKDVIGTITAGQVEIGSGITFATIQTMCKLDLSQYKDMWDVIIVDECHRCCGTPTAVTMFSTVLNSLAARHKYGLSATVHRADGLIKATFALLGGVVWKVPDEAVSDRVLQIGIHVVNTSVPLSNMCLNTDGTLNFPKLTTYLTKNQERNEIIIDSILDNKDRPSLILTSRIEHLDTLMNMLPEAERAKAVKVTGRMTTKRGKLERVQAIHDMRNGNKTYLFATYQLAKEGLDIPCLERLYMATPVKDYAIVTQSIGRIARVSPGKEDPIVYDFVDHIGYLQRTYKKRCTAYRKNHCYWVEGD